LNVNTFELFDWEFWAISFLGGVAMNNLFRKKV